MFEHLAQNQARREIDLRRQVQRARSGQPPTRQAWIRARDRIGVRVRVGLGRGARVEVRVLLSCANRAASPHAGERMGVCLFTASGPSRVGGVHGSCL